jgi:hypothetical protein
MQRPNRIVQVWVRVEVKVENHAPEPGFRLEHKFRDGGGLPQEREISETGSPSGGRLSRFFFGNHTPPSTRNLDPVVEAAIFPLDRRRRGNS